MVDHLGHFAFAATKLFDNHTHKRFGAVDDEQLQRLMQRAVDGAGQDLGLSYRQLETLTAHHLNQNGELEFAAPHYLERVGATRFLYPDRYVCQQLLIEAVAKIARGDVLALSAGERRGVDRERHRDGRLVDLDVWQRLRILRARYGLADGYALNPCDCKDVTGMTDGFIDALEILKRREFCYSRLLEGSVQLGDRDLVTAIECA